MTNTSVADVEQQLVAGLRREQQVIAEAEVRRLNLIVEWAVLHQAPPEANLHHVGFGVRWIAVAGAGAPWVDEFAVTDLAATLGMSDQAGRALVGQTLELRHRLPRLWQRVLGGRVPAWKALRIASQTRCLAEAGAADVDQQLSHVADNLSTSVVDRLVTGAKVRLEPDRARPDARFVTIDDGAEVHADGLMRVHGLLDAADALDLERTLSAVAAQLAALGSTDSLDVRRSAALGEIARAQLALELGTQPVGRGVELVIHLSPDSPVGRLENTRSPVDVETIREWCRTAGIITLRPVVDLNESVHVIQYEVSDRIRRRVVWRDQTCVFPRCERRASACDLDHVVPYDVGGETSTDNLAPLCRRHHRAKTFGDFTYRVIGPGAFEWTLPSGFTVRRDHLGTHPPVPPDE